MPYLILQRKQGLGSSNYWISTLGGSGADYGNAIAVDSSGNVYVTGTTNSQGAGGNDIVVAKYNTNGTIQWQRALGGSEYDYGRGIAVDSSGNVYVTGYTSSQGAGGDDIVVAKYNTNGTIQWQRALGGSGGDVGRAIAVDSSGNVYVTGYTSSDIVVAKYDTNGTIQWQRALGGSGGDVGQAIAVDSSGNVYVTGYTSSQGAGGNDIVVAKYDTNGTIQWQRALGGTNSDIGYGIAVDSSGNVYITGSTTSQGAGGNDIVVAKYDTNGTIQWQRALGGTGNEYGYGIAVDLSGNTYITGYTDSQGAGGNDIVVAKLSSDGSITGTSGNFTIQETTLTAATTTLTQTNTALTTVTTTLTGQSISLTDQDITLTSSTTIL